MTYETILVEQRGAVTLITLNRPKALNALNNQVLEEAIVAFAAFDADDSQRCAGRGIMELCAPVACCLTKQSTALAHGGGGLASEAHVGVRPSGELVVRLASA